MQKNSFSGIPEVKVSGSFLGQFENSIANRRISVPQPFRKLFSQKAKMRVTALRGFRNTIYIFPWDNWKNLETKLSNGSDDEKNLLKKLRIYASMLTIEGPGRILLPQKLLDIANISKKVIIVGEGKYFSLWNPDNFKKHLSEIEKDYDPTLKKNEYAL